MDNISTHRPNTANPRRTQVNSVILPGQRTAEADEQGPIAAVSTANPRRVNLMDAPI